MEWFPPGVSFDEAPRVLHDEARLPTRILRDVQGMEMPVFSFASTSTPGVDGVEFGDATATRPRVVLPVFLWAESPEQLRIIKSDLIASLVPKLGTGRLLQTVGEGADGGTARYIWARYRGGMEGSGADMGDGWWRFTIAFEAQDPFWYSIDPIRATWRGLPVTPFFPVRFPIRLSKSGLTVDSELQVHGDGETWPTFDLKGPLTRVRVRTTDDDEAFWEINRALSAAEMVRVVTRPDAEEVSAWVASAGGWIPAAEPNAYESLHSDSWFLPLGFGTELVLEAEGTGADTLVELTADEAWWSQ